MKKIFGIFICVLLIATAIPVMSVNETEAEAIHLIIIKQVESGLSKEYSNI